MALTRPRYSQIYDTDYKQSVRVATTADVGNLLATGNITNTVDGVTLVANDRVLVKDQDSAEQNGIYTVVSAGTGSNGTWARSRDTSANDRLTAGMTTIVSEGNTNANKTFRLATPDPIVVGITELSFVDPFAATGAGGANTQVQFNDVSQLAGSAAFTFNKTSNLLTVSGNVVSSGKFIGDGSLLTGLPAGYTDSNVAAYLPTHTGNVSANYFVGNLVTSGSIEGALFVENSILNLEAGTSNLRIYSSNNIAISSNGIANVIVVGPTATTITGNLLPSANVTYDLGSPTQRWRDGWFSGTTIHIGTESMSVGEDGTWAFTSGGSTVEFGTEAVFNPPSANIAGNVTATDYLFANGVPLMTAVDSMVSTANVNLKGYTDNLVSTANVNLKGYTDNQISTANLNLKGYVDAANTIQSNQIAGANAAITTANVNMKGYVDGTISNLINGAPGTLDTLNEIAAALGNDANLSVTLTNQISGVQGNVTAANAAITTANVNMKGYVDSVANLSSYSNANVTAYLPTHSGNIGASSVNATNLYGTIRTAAQTSITSVGTLTGLTVSSIASVAGLTTTGSTNVVYIAGFNGAQIKLNSGGVFAGWIGNPSNERWGLGWASDSTGNGITGTALSWTPSNVSIGNTLIINSSNSTIAIANGGTNGVGNIGASGQGFNSIFGVNLFGTLQTASQTNITSVGTLGSLSVTGNITSASGKFIGDGSLLTGLPAGYTDANVTAYLPTHSGNIGASSVNATNLYGTIRTAAQTSITSVGTLTGLTVNGATVLGNSSGIRLRTVESGGVIYIQAGNGVSGSANTITFAPWTNTVSTMSIDIANGRVGIKKSTPTVELDVDGAGAFSGSLTVTGNVNIAGNLNFTAGGSADVLYLGNKGITGVNALQFNDPGISEGVSWAGGNLWKIVESPDALTNASGNLQIVQDSTRRLSVRTDGTVDIPGVLRINSGNAVTAIINGGTNGVGNIGASGAGFNTVFARATSAQYADLAEIYTSDKKYIPGTVVVFGGDKEVTVSTTSHDPAVAGVVSTNPAYLMNDSVEGVAVALQGRVPCRVLGPINKGDRVVSSDIQGVAERLDMSKYQPGCIIGKALESMPDGEIATIEVVVGRN